MLKIQSRHHLGTILLVMFVGAIVQAQKPELIVQQGHVDGVQSVAFSPDGRTLASGSNDASIKLWNLHRPYFL